MDDTHARCGSTIKWRKLSNREFDDTKLPEEYRDFSYWDDEGYLVTLSLHSGALEQLGFSQAKP